MSFNNSYTAVTGATYTAAQYNTYTRDNLTAIWVYTTTGDLAYATSATTLARLGIGAAGSILTSNGTAPQWSALGSAYQFLQVNNGGTAPAWGGLHFCLAFHSTTQLAGTGIATVLSFNSEVSDAQGWHNPSSNPSRITAGVTGYYQAACYFGYGGAGGSGMYFDSIEMRINGGTGWMARHWVEVSAYDKHYGCSTPIFALTAGQYVEWYLEQNSGGTRTINAYANASLLRVA